MRADIIYGPSGSGKTTRGVELLEISQNTVWIERDKYRSQIIPQFMRSGWTEYRPNRYWEGIVSGVWNHNFHLAIAGGFDILVTDTLCKIRDRQNLTDILTHYQYEVKFTRISTSMEDCIVRDSLRGNLSVGESVIHKQFENLNKHREHV